MKRKKSAIEVMAKYCTIWQRPDIFKAWYEQATDPFNTEDMYSERMAVNSYEVFTTWFSTKEKNEFWSAVLFAIDKNDPSRLPAPFQRASQQPEPVLKWHEPITPETAREGRFLVDEDEEKYEILFTNGKVWILGYGDDEATGNYSLKELQNRFTHVTD